MIKKQKLELTGIVKGERSRLEPCIMPKDQENSYFPIEFANAIRSNRGRHDRK